MAKVKTAGHGMEEREQRVTDNEPTRAEIEERAYYRYVSRGCIDGFDGEDWQLAETELRGEQPVIREPDARDRAR